MANDFVLPRLCDLGILHELCPTLNKLFIVDEDIENVLKVHPTWSQYLLDAGLRVPILNQYLSSLKHGNQDVYKKCRDEGRRRIRSIRQKLGIGTLITRICIDETFLHTVEPEIEFEIMIALLNGQHKFTKENIPELLVDGKLFSKEAILWAVSGCNKHNHKDLLDEMCNSLSEQTDIHHRYDPLYTNMVRHVAMCDYPEMFIALLNFLGDKRSQVTFELWLGVSDMPEIVCEAIFDENSYSDAPIQNFFSHLENFCSQALLFGKLQHVIYSSLFFLNHHSTLIRG